MHDVPLASDIGTVESQQELRRTATGRSSHPVHEEAVNIKQSIFSKLRTQTSRFLTDVQRKGVELPNFMADRDGVWSGRTPIFRAVP